MARAEEPSGAVVNIMRHPWLMPGAVNFDALVFLVVPPRRGSIVFSCYPGLTPGATLCRALRALQPIVTKLCQA
jgi:hypothetical protein